MPQLKPTICLQILRSRLPVSFWRTSQDGGWTIQICWFHWDFISIDIAWIVALEDVLFWSSILEFSWDILINLWFTAMLYTDFNHGVTVSFWFYYRPTQLPSVRASSWQIAFFQGVKWLSMSYILVKLQFPKLKSEKSWLVCTNQLETASFVLDSKPFSEVVKQLVLPWSTIAWITWKSLNPNTDYKE